MNIKKYLKKSVFYPCSGTDTTPVERCAPMFSKFVYVDVALDEQKLLHELQNHGFGGYRLLKKPKRLTPRAVFGYSWNELARRHSYELSILGQLWQANNAFILLAYLKGDSRGVSQPAAKTIQIMFIRFFAVAAYAELYVRKQIAPDCLVHMIADMDINPDYTYHNYISHLHSVLLANPKGLPRSFIHGMLCQPGLPGSLPLAENYRFFRRWRIPAPYDQLSLLKLVPQVLPKEDVVYKPFKGELLHKHASDKELISKLLALCDQRPVDTESQAHARIKRKLTIRRTKANPPRKSRTAGDLPPIDGWLGLYNHATQTIILYEKAIRQCARLLNVNPKQLCNVVLLHETGHWISHVWPIVGKHQWDAMSWCATLPSIHEFLAQSVAYHALVALDRTAEQNIYEQLLKRQPSEYQQTVIGSLWTDSLPKCSDNWWFIMLPHILKEIRHVGLFKPYIRENTNCFSDKKKDPLILYAEERGSFDIPDEVIIRIKM